MQETVNVLLTSFI